MNIIQSVAKLYLFSQGLLNELKLGHSEYCGRTHPSNSWKFSITASRLWIFRFGKTLRILAVIFGQLDRAQY